MTEITLEGSLYSIVCGVESDSEDGEDGDDALPSFCRRSTTCEQKGTRPSSHGTLFVSNQVWPEQKARWTEKTRRGRNR